MPETSDLTEYEQATLDRRYWEDWGKPFGFKGIHGFSGRERATFVSDDCYVTVSHFSGNGGVQANFNFFNRIRDELGRLQNIVH